MSLNNNNNTNNNSYNKNYNNTNHNDTNYNIDDFINVIITDDAKPRNTVQLSFINDIEPMDLFTFCMQFFDSLCKYKYGDSNGKVDISTWSLGVIKSIQDYYNSFGMNINIIMLEPNSKNYAKIKYYESRNYKNYTITSTTKLEDIYYVMYHNSTNMYYVINFNYI